MNILKVFGIERITPTFVAAAVATLIWLGLAVNGLYDCTKVLAGIFKAEAWIPFLLPASFCGWVYFLYRKCRETAPAADASAAAGQVKAHKGIVSALSKPAESADELCRKIQETDERTPDALFEIRSIGQLFRGIYEHQETLRYVWLLTTEASLPYQECVRIFLKRFVPGAEICGEDEKVQRLCHLTAKTDQEWIEQSKTALAEIYSREYLSQTGLNISDIITDISGGPKSLTVGMTFGALGSDVDIQYVEQQGHRVIPLRITPDMILEQMGDHLRKLAKK
jgi:hypothetical protein